jgi:hypothetical protein
MTVGLGTKIPGKNEERTGRRLCRCGVDRLLKRIDAAKAAPAAAKPLRVRGSTQQLDRLRKRRAEREAELATRTTADEEKISELRQTDQAATARWRGLQGDALEAAGAVARLENQIEYVQRVARASIAEIEAHCAAEVARMRAESDAAVKAAPADADIAAARKARETAELAYKRAVDARTLSTAGIRADVEKLRRRIAHVVALHPEVQIDEAPVAGEVAP